ncbi:helix-turn-helix transcriptional regulator [Aliamphritea hakodatensis]|uniref:helix-turn-helix transcriptional regulator n=1 Tax=Aliamphritea hakodatensis TaxID=2895352 RepID=UPI0022FD3C2D|nr:metalloregulator ArsR/SmtB family transcription factor [Aliamphritea hakodatensis]
MNDSSDRILYLLKTKGPQTAAALGKLLDITSMGARQHLLTLEERQLVSWEDISAGRGRPSRYWQLTPQAWQQFPDSHGELMITMLDSIQTVFGDAGLEQLISQREQQLDSQYHAALTNCPTLTEKLEKLAELRSLEGYMAQWQEDEEGYWFIENHCPICAAAQRCQNFCRSELQLFQSLFAAQATVNREDYILDGARRCSYRISPL